MYEDEIGGTSNGKRDLLITQPAGGYVEPGAILPGQLYQLHLALGRFKQRMVETRVPELVGYFEDHVGEPLGPQPTSHVHHGAPHGGLIRQINVLVDRDRLRAYGVGLMEVVDVLRTHNINPRRVQGGPEGTVLWFRDEFGELHHWPAAETERLTPMAVSLVPRELVTGRAVLVFWPFKLSFGLWRLEWVH